MTIVGKLPDPQKPRRGRRRLKTLAVVPTLLTLGNLLCGFAAIYFGLRAMQLLGAGPVISEEPALPRNLWERMLPSFLSFGAGLILAGMIFDGLDGLIARVTRSTTDFGGQLDSLADVVTCGVAPATLMLAFMTQQLAAGGEFVGGAIVPSPISEHFLGRAAWVCAAVYVAFTAIRLARYNVEHAKADFDYKTFRGLPSPGAAAIIAAMIIFQDQMGTVAKGVILFALPVAALATALLMVSRIPYRRIDQTYLVGRKPFGQFVFFMVILAVFWSYKAPTLLFAAVLFGLSGPILWLVRTLRGKRSGPTTTAQADEQTGEGRKLA